MHPFSAVTYPDLDKVKRRTIWAAFLKLAGVGIEDKKKKVLSHGDATPDASVPKVEKDEEEEPKSWVSAKYLDKLAAKTSFNGALLSPLLSLPSRLRILTD
jgi:hypothetical protein